LARGDELARFAAKHELPLVSIADLITYRRRHEPQVRRTTVTPVPTEHGMVRVVGYESVHAGTELICVVSGEVAGQRDVPVYIHIRHASEDPWGWAASARDSDLHHAMNGIAADGRGVVIYVPPPDPTSEEAFAVLAELGVQSFRLISPGRGVHQVARAPLSLSTGVA
jgi:3,4-dihydroxy 2-butanone 4-phosphate synthase/GTP cyclohydrolase II